MTSSNIRNGFYGIFHQIHFPFFEKRVEHFVPEHDKEYLLIFNGNKCDYEGFEKSPHGGFFRAVFARELQYAYKVNTRGEWKGHVLDVSQVGSDPQKIRVTTRDPEVGTKLPMLESPPGSFFQHIDVNELQRLWEVRSAIQGHEFPSDLSNECEILLEEFFFVARGGKKVGRGYFE